MHPLVLVEPAVEIPVVLDPRQRREHLSPPALSAKIGDGGRDAFGGRLDGVDAADALDRFAEAPARAREHRPPCGDPLAHDVGRPAGRRRYPT